VRYFAAHAITVMPRYFARRHDTTLRALKKAMPLR